MTSSRRYWSVGGGFRESRAYDLWSVGISWLEMILGTPHVFSITDRMKVILHQALHLDQKPQVCIVDHLLAAMLKQCLLACRARLKHNTVQFFHNGQIHTHDDVCLCRRSVSWRIGYEVSCSSASIPQGQTGESSGLRGRREVVSQVTEMRSLLLGAVLRAQSCRQLGRRTPYGVVCHPLLPCA